MFIKKNIAKRGDKTYVSHLLVESVNTPAGPRHKVICNLGKMNRVPPVGGLKSGHRVCNRSLKLEIRPKAA